MGKNKTIVTTIRNIIRVWFKRVLPKLKNPTGETLNVLIKWIFKRAAKAPYILFFLLYHHCNTADDQNQKMLALSNSINTKTDNFQCFDSCCAIEKLKAINETLNPDKRKNGNDFYPEYETLPLQDCMIEYWTISQERIDDSVLYTIKLCADALYKNLSLKDTHYPPLSTTMIDSEADMYRVCKKVFRIKV